MRGGVEEVGPHEGWAPEDASCGEALSLCAVGGRSFDGKKKICGPVPVPSREETTTWVLEAFNAITKDDIMAACRAAYFPKGMKLSELEDLTYFRNSDSDSSYDSSSDSDSDSGTDPDEDEPISDLSSSSDDSSDSDDNPDEVIWSKVARGVWGMAHACLPKPKPAPKPRAKASSKASSSDEHVQLFHMVYDRKKGFQSEHL